MVSGMNRERVVRPAGDFADGTVVTKLTGEKQYQIKREIRVYVGCKVDARIKPKTGHVFLCSQDGNNVEMPETKPVIGRVACDIAWHCLQEHYDEVVT